MNQTSLKTIIKEIEHSIGHKIGDKVFFAHKFASNKNFQVLEGTIGSFSVGKDYILVNIAVEKWQVYTPVAIQNVFSKRINAVNRALKLDKEELENKPVYKKKKV